MLGLMIGGASAVCSGSVFSDFGLSVLGLAASGAGVSSTLRFSIGGSPTMTTSLSAAGRVNGRHNAPNRVLFLIHFVSNCLFIMEISAIYRVALASLVASAVI